MASQMVSCRCGCGATFPLYDSKGRIRHFLPGHNSRVNHPMSGKQHSEASKQRMSNAHSGKQLSEKTKRAISKALSGNRSYRWNGGVCVANNRKLVLKKDHPYAHRKLGYVFNSRLVMEKRLGRFLRPEEVVHHINGNSLDDRPENLMLFANQSLHARHHSRLKAVEG